MRILPRDPLSDRSYPVSLPSKIIWPRTRAGRYLLSLSHLSVLLFSLSQWVSLAASLSPTSMHQLLSDDFELHLVYK